jgi:sodium/potassium/calcium exchanger 6
VGDLIADCSVARAGQARMAMSSCFGSPLLNDILGLGISLLVATSSTYPNDFHGTISSSLYVAWGFLFASLLTTAAVFHAYAYAPPRTYAYTLFAIYLTFALISILGAAGLSPFQ